MKNRSVLVLCLVWGIARVSRAGFGVSPKQSLLRTSISRFDVVEGKVATARRARQQARRLRYPIWCIAGLQLVQLILFAHEAGASINANGEVEAEPVVVSATRTDIPRDQSPASITVIDSLDFEIKQTERVADALREAPGLSVVQTGTAGQLTSVFMRGLRSEHTQVLLDGVPLNQGLAGLFNFADLTIDNIDRVEIVRGPQSTIYGPRALAGVIQLFTKQGDGPAGVTLAAEGGSYGTFREWLQSDGRSGELDYSLGVSRFDTDNARPNNQYRNTAGIISLGVSPNDRLRIGTLATYSNSDAGNPNTITTPRPLDNFLTERWLVAPHLDFRLTDWWDQKFIVSYDHERQLNDPNDDGFLFATRALFKRTTIDYQNDIRAASWLTLTSGFFYSRVRAEQERPFVLFGDKLVGDFTEQIAGFWQATARLENLILVGGGRYDSFNQFGGIWTYRFAGNYKINRTNTSLHASVAEGFSPPSSQDKIFRFNPNPGQPLAPLEPEEGTGWDVGVEQRFWENRIAIGATYFHYDLSNLIGFNGLFETLNLGSAETQGLEAELHVTPINDLLLAASYTYLDTEKTSASDVGAPKGSRLPRRPRNEAYASASYLWCKKLRTTLSAKWVNAREEINANFFGPNRDIEDYTLINFAAEYEVNQNLSIFGRIDNLGNEHYAEVFGFPALGRAAYGGLKVRF